MIPRARQDRSIRDKANVAILSASLAGLVVTALALFVWELFTYRPRTAREMQATASLLSAHLHASLSFDDSQVATKTLATLRARPEVRLACVYRIEGPLFAGYEAPGASRACPRNAPSSSWFRGESFAVVHQVVHAGETVGALLLVWQRDPLPRRVLRYAPVFGTVALALAAVSLWLSTLLARGITRPVAELSHTAAEITRRRDYTLRARAFSEDEIGQLTTAFNEMVGRMQAELTARERAQAEREALLVELRQALHARDEFLSIASHELRTPLSALSLQAGALRRAAERAADAGMPAASVHQRATAMVKQGERLERLVAGLLDVSRIMMGKVTLHPERIDLPGLIRETIDGLASGPAPLASPIALQAEPVEIFADRLRVEQVVTNLLTNAVKYGESKPIEVTVQKDHASARVTVRDHGMGIASEDIERIFQRFERAVSERHFGGLGLGLWIVRQVLDAMGGTVSVESWPGEGSLFTIELPLGESPFGKAEHAGEGDGGRR